MTKAELEQILTTNLKDIHFRSSDQTYEGVLNCLVEAYNRAIDDSINRLIFGGDKIANINEDDLAGLIRLKIKGVLSSTTPGLPVPPKLGKFG